MSCSSFLGLLGRQSFRVSGFGVEIEGLLFSISVFRVQEFKAEATMQALMSMAGIVMMMLLMMMMMMMRPPKVTAHSKSKRSKGWLR